MVAFYQVHKKTSPNKRMFYWALLYLLTCINSTIHLFIITKKRKCIYKYKEEGKSKPGD